MEREAKPQAWRLMAKRTLGAMTWTARGATICWDGREDTTVAVMRRSRYTSSVTRLSRRGRVPFVGSAVVENLGNGRAIEGTGIAGLCQGDRRTVGRE